MRVQPRGLADRGRGRLYNAVAGLRPGDRLGSQEPDRDGADVRSLSVGSDRIDAERLQLCFELEESTSASTLLLSSIDGARRQFAREGHELLERAVTSARLLRERLASDVPELDVVDLQTLRARPGVTAVDLTHVLIETASIG
jgi:arginine decarboxylase